MQNLRLKVRLTGCLIAIIFANIISELLKHGGKQHSAECRNQHNHCYELDRAFRSAESRFFSLTKKQK